VIAWIALPGAVVAFLAATEEAPVGGRGTRRDPAPAAVEEEPEGEVVETDGAEASDADEGAEVDEVNEAGDPRRA
jgi:hypothetical protein